MTGNMPAELQILEFSDAGDWRRWLEQNHADDAGVWLRLFKKGSGKDTFTYAEALDEALCYGWIDAIMKSEGKDSYIQRFTPRRAKSMWSKRNREHIDRLTAAGRMHPAGLAQVEAAKRDGRWDEAYDPPSTTTVPEDFLELLKKNRAAFGFFQTLDKANVYAITWRLQTAKRPETREKRMRQFVDMLARGEKLH
ncbi:MAG: hypothetical protein HONBIEJF_00932 [Fimbriimonadaceae bacterium]|nr:hypothetical protein [Fimbriimonadaceae bacterium]